MSTKQGGSGAGAPGDPGTPSPPDISPKLFAEPDSMPSSPSNGTFRLDGTLDDEMPEVPPMPLPPSPTIEPWWQTPTDYPTSDLYMAAAAGFVSMCCAMAAVAYLVVTFW